ncbi:citrate (pro-3S)-lyase subunit beta [Eubacteriales bacterium OttesenSCG-928-K08]|nr:citrate (pro-3S)-lyase subunit beta [Eubacteriales bacterium OttesenSCG-928-K08]
MERLRRTMLFVPGNNPGMLRDAHIYGADSILFDLEDSVSMGEKNAARLLVYHSLKAIQYGNCELVVRVNPLNTPYGRQDIEAVVRAGAQVIRLPKTESVQDILDMELEIERVEKEAGIPVGRTKLMAAVESALGVLNAQSICVASKRLIGIAIGAEDYCANIKTQRTKEGLELFFARNMVLNAARAAGIAALDTVFSDVEDMDGFETEVRLIKGLGFDGKSVINPRQIGPVHRIFLPTEKEITSARRVIRALREAEARGSGVVSVDGRMVDRPVVLRAQRIIQMAVASNLIVDEEEMLDE